MMSFFNFSGSASHSSEKSRSWIDPRTQEAQWNNYGQAQGLLGQYTPTSPDQISQYMNPYEDQAVHASLDDLNYMKQLDLNRNKDQAIAQHAFGGSRGSVADALTEEAYARQGGLLSSNMRNTGFWNALGAAQQENTNQFQYPLQRQGLLNQTLGGITPQTFSKGSGTTVSAGFNGGFGQQPGGGDISKYFKG